MSRADAAVHGIKKANHAQADWRNWLVAPIQ